MIKSEGDISGLVFQLNGDINAGGDIFLNEVTSYSAEDLKIPIYIEYPDADIILPVIMQCYNIKLRNIRLTKVVQV